MNETVLENDLFALVKRTLAAGAMPALHQHDADEALYVLDGTSPFTSRRTP